MFRRIIWFGTGAVSGAIGTLWAERKVRRAIKAQRRAAAQRVVAPPNSTREAVMQTGLRAKSRVQNLYAKYRGRHLYAKYRGRPVVEEDSDVVIRS